MNPMDPSSDDREVDTATCLRFARYLVEAFGSTQVAQQWGEPRQGPADRRFYSCSDWWMAAGHEDGATTYTWRFEPYGMDAREKLFFFGEGITTTRVCYARHNVPARKWSVLIFDLFNQRVWRVAFPDVVMEAEPIDFMAVTTDFNDPAFPAPSVREFMADYCRRLPLGLGDELAWKLELNA